MREIKAKVQCWRLVKLPHLGARRCLEAQKEWSGMQKESQERGMSVTPGKGKGCKEVRQISSFF